MKVVGGAILALLFVCAALLILFPEKIPLPARKLLEREPPKAVSSGNPFFAPKAVAFPFGKDHLDYGDELLHNKRYDEAVEAFASIYATDPADANKASALIAACDTMTRKSDPTSAAYARELCEQYLRQYPEGLQTVTAHYYLGYLLAGEQDISGALAHFTTITADFPNSPQAPAAAFNAKILAGFLRQQNDSQKARILRIVGPLIPRNPGALAALLGYTVSILGWLTYDWDRVKKKLVVEKHPLAWAVLVLSIGLFVANYASELRNTSLMALPQLLAHLKQ
jgi:tetratricopeptide (TPR) repeat protein